MDRVATFRTFIERSPKDPFPRYGLAMELKQQRRLDEARAAFDELLALFPDYVPAYLQAAAVLRELGEPRDAVVGVYEQGIATAQAKGDLHAKKELEAALADL